MIKIDMDAKQQILSSKCAPFVSGIPPIAVHHFLFSHVIDDPERSCYIK